jgi:hypothetical protein
MEMKDIIRHKSSDWQSFQFYVYVSANLIGFE